MVDAFSDRLLNNNCANARWPIMYRSYAILVGCARAAISGCTSCMTAWQSALPGARGSTSSFAARTRMVRRLNDIASKPGAIRVCQIWQSKPNSGAPGFVVNRSGTKGSGPRCRVVLIDPSAIERCKVALTADGTLRENDGVDREQNSHDQCRQRDTDRSDLKRLFDCVAERSHIECQIMFAECRYGAICRSRAIVDRTAM